MGKIDAAILEALAQAMIFSVQELDASAGTEKEHICWVKTNFITHIYIKEITIARRSEDAK